MELLKKHYEKVLLGVVLLGLVVAVAFLPFKISGDKQALDDKRSGLISKSVKPLTNLDLTLPETALKRMAAPATLNFAAPNKLFNPMPWQKKADDTLVLATSVGASAATVTNITPLYLRITLNNVTVSDTGVKYSIGVQKEAAARPQDRGKRETYCTLNAKNDTFTLQEVQGKPEDLSTLKLTLLLNDTGETAVISTNKAFTRVDGYKASIFYDPEGKKWLDQRVGARLLFNFEEYNIVAISKNEVVLSAKSNQKKWTVKYNAAP